MHHEQEEWFYVVKGEYVIEVGEERALRVGARGFGPRAAKGSARLGLCRGGDRKTDCYLAARG